MFRNGCVTIVPHPAVCRNALHIDPYFDSVGIIDNLGLLAHILVWDTVEAIPVYLEVICAVYLYLLFVFEVIRLNRERKEIWQFLRLELLPAAVCPAFHDFVVVLVVQLR